MKKTPEQIARAIQARGQEAMMASTFQRILMEEILAGEYTDPVEIANIKSKVSLIMLQYRLDQRKKAELESIS